MGLHTTRLLFTVLFLILALSGLVSGFWLQALFWAVIAAAVGSPFVQKGRIDLFYDEFPNKIIYVMPVPDPAKLEAALATLAAQ